MKKLYKYALWLAAAVAIAPMTACNDNDEVDPYTLNYVYLYQPDDTHANVEYKANGDFMSGLTDDPLEIVPVRLTKPAPADMQVEIAIDPTLVDEYNEEKGTEYTFLKGAEVLTPTLTILKGKYISEQPITVAFTSHDGFTGDAENLILPIVIKNAPGCQTSKSSRVFLTFNSTYRPNYINASSAVRYANALVELPNWQDDFKEIDLNSLFSLTYAPYEDVKVTVEIDPSKVAEYNETYGTSLTLKSDCSLASGTVTVTPEQTGANFKLKTGDLSTMTAGTSFVVPLTLKSVEGGSVETGTPKTVFIVMRAVAKELTISSTEYKGRAINYPAGTTAFLNETVDWYDKINPDSWGYGYVKTTDVLTIHLGSEVMLCSMYFDHWYSSYAPKKVSLQTSVDGETWDDWGTATADNYYGQYYLNLSYSCNVKHIKLSFSDFRSSSCEIDGIRLRVE